MTIAMRTDLNMPKGKIGAHFGHAMRMFLTEAEGYKLWFHNKSMTEAQLQWINDGLSTIVGVKGGNESEVLELYNKAIEIGLDAELVYDAGVTMFNGVKTLTCVRIGPDYTDKIDEITKNLKLL